MNKEKAINLMIEKIYSNYDSLYNEAKIGGFEYELNTIKMHVLDYLNFLKKSP